MKNQQIRSPRKLIEVALPLDAINFASAAEKQPGIGAHPRGLHLWWARRPQAAARAVLFSQLVNDPGFERGNGFQRGLKKEAAKHARTRIFKILEQLVRWENRDNEAVFAAAKNEIWNSWRETCELNKDHPEAATLFDPEKLPAFHDPFAGGGAIPLEAQRLGLESFASDLNPVAVLINKAMIEIPPRFDGREPVGPARKDTRIPAIAPDWQAATGLAEDIQRYGALLEEEAFQRIGHLYPKIDLPEQHGGGSGTVIAWLWARTVKSPNPAFAHIDVPLVANFALSGKPGREAYVLPIVDADRYRFEVKQGSVPAALAHGTKAPGRGANFVCLLSNSPISGDYIKSEGQAGRMGTRLMAIVAEGHRKRVYLSPTTEHEETSLRAKPIWRPTGKIPARLTGGTCVPYGLKEWGDIYTSRQLLALTTFSDLIGEMRTTIESDAISHGWRDDKKGLDDGGDGAAAYADALSLYLAFAVDRLADYGSSIATWKSSGEQVMQTFKRQAIPMTWDFPESNFFAGKAICWENAVKYTAQNLIASNSGAHSTPGHAAQADAQHQSISALKVISTDPPYYDNIGYADLSDFFYIWLRRSLRDIYPSLFATMEVPKAEELVAAAYRHGGKQQAEEFFLDGMTDAMQSLARQAHPAFPVTIYYAFKQSDTTDAGTASTGWETFLEAVIEAGFAITGTWPMRTELSNRMIGSGTNALASSIILACRQRELSAVSISRREFLAELKEGLAEAVEAMINGTEGMSPVAPVDLAQAVIGPGMAIFSKYSSVLEADGTSMTVHAALTLINRMLTQGKDEFDANTLFSLSWFEQHGWNQGEFGSADVLARAKGTSVDLARGSGVLASSAGKVRLLKPAEYDLKWNPQKDMIIPTWELLHHLSSQFEHGGTEEAAKLLARVEPAKVTPASVRKLAYQLYTLCERTGKAEDARRYNNLVLAWDTISQLAESLGRAGTQANLFQGV